MPAFSRIETTEAKRTMKCFRRRDWNKTVGIIMSMQSSFGSNGWPLYPAIQGRYLSVCSSTLAHRADTTSFRTVKRPLFLLEIDGKMRRRMLKLRKSLVKQDRTMGRSHVGCQVPDSPASPLSEGIFSTPSAAAIPFEGEVSGC
ncbi:hypothetical protein CMUS01_10392 [Colletotrichum musicola]|uniref:Uncharacterized protein n=1 Tax=Colletotrichum musicola TaxID=2175873 RepID=A0A8H6K3L3_9PEZI|nr:hypothetical protein CMUS01_10392 [Colletotrichum musicola]